MRSQKNTNITLGDLVAAVTDEVTPLIRDKRRVNLLVSYILHDLFLSCRVRLRNGFRNGHAVRRQNWPAVALGMLLIHPTAELEFWRNTKRSAQTIHR